MARGKNSGARAQGARQRHGGGVMEDFGLEAPIKEQLEAILQDYPGGQLLSEALQNAEDAGATDFALVLDCREHNVADSRLAGPAFVLLDNGNGFSEREWTSLKMLNKSEKREYDCRDRTKTR